MKTSLERCPFCNSHNLHGDLNQSVYWIACLECRACGPTSLDKTNAILLWNGTCEAAGYTSLVTDPSVSNRRDRKAVEVFQ
jgi:hypothetical protein